MLNGAAPAQFRAEWHPLCVACRPIASGGLGLRFEADEEGVRAEFACAAEFQGYPERVHGGVIAILLDAAMTQALFARGLRGYTVKLQIRYRRPARVGVCATICGRLGESRPPLHLLSAELRQDGEVRASAVGSFWEAD